MKQHTPTIIGLTGFAGTGKDTVRTLLEGHGFIGLAFADPIRQMLRELFASNGISEAHMDVRALKEQPIYQLSSPAKPVSYRMLAQTLGTEWGRSIQPDLWVRLAQSYMDDLRANTHGDLPSFVISDVRFPNEADWVRAQGGTIWRIVRPGTAPVRGHASESGVGNITPDRLVMNIGTVQDLQRTVAKALGVNASETADIQVASYGAFHG